MGWDNGGRVGDGKGCHGYEGSEGVGAGCWEMAFEGRPSQRETWLLRADVEQRWVHSTLPGLGLERMAVLREKSLVRD